MRTHATEKNPTQRLQVRVTPEPQVGRTAGYMAADCSVAVMCV